jgi:transcriptional regulator GlxA family with amidase domain
MKTHHRRNRFRFVRAVSALIVTGMATLVLVGCGDDVPPPPAETDVVTSERQAQAFIEAIKPRRPGRPVIAMVALNRGTETTDFLLPHALLQRADIADVQAVAPQRGRVMLYPTLQVEVPQDLAGFDRNHPSGADYVIVPAMIDDNDPAITAWLRRQADQGARIIGVCAGGLVVGQAGLLDGRRFAAHWYYRDTLRERHPTGTYVPHQRYVIDRDVATTTGITASLPTMLALIEAIGGREKAQALATELGMTSWTPVHDSSLFGLDVRRASTFLLNKAVFWGHQQWSVDVQDDIALALTADAWSRTGRVTVEAASAAGPVKLRSGVVLIAEPARENSPRLPLAQDLKPMQQLDRTLCEIAERYGDSRREWVMMELEYPGALTDCAE